MSSASHAFAALDNPTVAQVNGWAQGTLGYAPAATNQGSITAEVNLTSLTVTATVVAGRRIRVQGFVTFSSTVVDDTAEVRIYQDGIFVNRADVICRPAAIGATTSVFAVLQPSAGSHTWLLSGQRAAGTGTVTMSASAAAPAFILVEDIGAV